MTAGILELIAKGPQDLFLTSDPEITFFKTVYRRHTLFSKSEHDINIKNNIHFGQKGNIDIPTKGDLLHRLTLSLTIPNVEIFVKTLTIGEVQTLLRNLGIVWNTPRNPNDTFDQSGFSVVESLIQQQIEKLTIEIRAFSEMRLELETGKFNPGVFKTEHIDDLSNLNSQQQVEFYFNSILDDFFKFDQFSIQFKFLRADLNDVINNNLFLPLANSNVVQTLMLNDFVNFAVSDDSNTATFNDDNIKFHYNTDTANYVIIGGINQVDSETVFRAGISNTYGNVPYTHLDSYEIFDITLTENNKDINGSADVQNVRSILLDNIRFGLFKNIKLMIEIYNSLTQTSKFTFYRKFPVVSVGTDVYNLNTTFANYSLLPSPPDDLKDNYTDKFVLFPEANEPDTVNHPFSNQAQNNVDDFHRKNRELFRTSKFTSYFDNLELWERTDVLTSPHTPPSTLPQPQPNMYFMNYIWFIMNEDIYLSIDRYLNERGLIPSNRSTLIAQLQSESVAIKNNISNYILLQNNFVTINSLHDTVKTVKVANGDIVIHSIIRPGNHISSAINSSERLLIPDYIIERFINVIEQFNAIGEEAVYNDVVKNILLDIVNLFITSIEDIPNYSVYIDRNQNISSDPVKKINNIDSSGTVYSDLISSIWYYIFTNYVGNYNDLYNNVLLGFEYYENNVGAELLSYLSQISQIYFNYIYDSSNFVPYNYYKNSLDYVNLIPENSVNDIRSFLNLKLIRLGEQFQTFDNNRGLLNFTDLVIVKDLFYFEKFDIIVDDITNRIENSPNIYFHDDHGSILDIVLITGNKYINSAPGSPFPTNNALDITDSLRLTYSSFLSSLGLNSNPYSQNIDPNKKKLWDEIKVDGIDIGNEINNFFNILYDFIYSQNGAKNLFGQINLINTKYDGFTSNTDIYDYMMDVVVDSSIMKDFPLQLENTIDTTNANLINYLNQKIDGNNQLLDDINGTNGLSSILELLENSLNSNTRAKFAWNRNLGYNIIDYLEIRIDDQLICKMTGEFMCMWYDVIKKELKNNLHSEMIGNVPELTTFDNSKKEEYELLIPIYLWFCKNIGLSIPLVALLHTKVNVSVKLKNFNEVAYFDQFSEFRRRLPLKTKFIAEYIYVDTDERKKLISTKMEYLIDVVKDSGDSFVQFKDLVDNSFFKELDFSNPCIEMFFAIQRGSFRDGTSSDALVPGQRFIDYYTLDIQEKINIFKSVQIVFFSRQREKDKDFKFFNLVVPYDKHNSTVKKGSGIYSFSIYPEQFQPSGAANLSNIDNVGIKFELTDNAVNILKNDIFRIIVYMRFYDILRVISGQAGLSFER